MQQQSKRAKDKDRKKKRSKNNLQSPAQKIITEGQVSDFAAVPGTSRKDNPTKSGSVGKVPLLLENPPSVSSDTLTLALATPVKTELQSPNNGTSSSAGPTTTNLHMDHMDTGGKPMTPTIMGK